MKGEWATGYCSHHVSSSTAITRSLKPQRESAVLVMLTVWNVTIHSSAKSIRMQISIAIYCHLVS